jgi:DNA-binding transcriptional MerR regulator
MKKLYKIGEISKLYNISSDILRHYEKIGLIIPDVRDENGYRYYSQKQIWKLNNIRNLRNLGVGLKEITEFMEDRNLIKTKEVIDFQLIKKELKDKKKNIEYFEKFEEYEKPVLKEIDKRYILYKKGNFHEEWEIDFELKKLKKKLPDDNDFIFTESEVGTTILKENWENNKYLDYSSTFVITTDKAENTIEKGLYLTFVFKGSYEKVREHYAFLKEYIKTNNLTVVGDIIEIYHIEIHITDNVNEYVTEIQIPVKK